MTDFATACATHFPGTRPADDYVAATVAATRAHGFTADNTIACVGLCRDEMSRALRRTIQEAWGEAFNFGGLAGMLFLGRTGFMAAHAHAPIEGGRERYVYYAMPHIALGAQGEIGVCRRPGRSEPSKACGALEAFLNELRGGRVRLTLDPLDLEQTILQQRLMEVVPHDHWPDLVEITHAAHDVIRADLIRMIELTVDPAQADYAVFTGVKIHGPDGGYVQPRDAWAMVGGVRTKLDLGVPAAAR
ncbi:MAG: hypothetical protein R3F65_14820 [bacterium]